MGRWIAWAVVLAALAGTGWRQPQLHALGQAIQADTSRQVVLLSTAWCPYCAQARDFLRRNNVDFAEYDIERSEEGQRTYMAVGGGGIPILIVDGVPIQGVDVQAWTAALARP